MVYWKEIVPRSFWGSLRDDSGQGDQLMCTCHHSIVAMGKEEEARALTAGITKGLQGVLGAIDAK